jgi:hypothetical protein
MRWGYAILFRHERPAMTWQNLLMHGRSVLSSIAVLLVAVAWSQCVEAQSPTRFELGLQIATVRSSEFDAAETGIGARFTWLPVRWIGTEAEIDFYPADFPDRPAFSRARVEGLFGVTAGPAFSRVRPYVRVRPGFLRFEEAPEPLACILIFPPPLACTLAAGATLFALDLGGGVEVPLTSNTFLRIDAGDRAVRHPGPVFDRRRLVRDEAFFSHDLRVAAGGGWRF